MAMSVWRDHRDHGQGTGRRYAPAVTLSWRNAGATLVRESLGDERGFRGYRGAAR